MAVLSRSSALTLQEAYQQVLLIRRFEERILELHGTEVSGSIHLSCGQEAIPVGALAALDPADRVVATYRGHHWAIARGVPIEGLLAEIAGRSTGVNGGRAGSAYLTAPDHGFFGENSIVGAGLPIAGGLALASQALASNRVIVVAFGDGATNQGASHEAIVMAVAKKLPIVFVCEHNDWSEMTPISAIVPVGLSERAAAYGLPAEELDGNDPFVVQEAVQRAATRARAGDGPTFLECRTARLQGHYQADIEHYRPNEDKEAAAQGDPLERLRQQLLETPAGDAAVKACESEVADALRRAEISALSGARPDPTTASDHVYTNRKNVARPELAAPSTTSTHLTYAQAVNAALRAELTERSETIIFGEDIAIPGGVFGATKNLWKEFGQERVFDTPIAESAILGCALGAALEGMRPIAEIMWSDFLLVALDQLVNQAANVSYISRGTVGAPLVIRCQQGITPGSCAQHSQSLEALLCHIPGLRVGMPSNPQDAFAMLRAAAASDDPCVIIECRALYQMKGDVNLDAEVEDVGSARKLRAGSDLTVVSWGRMANIVKEAADQLAGEGIELDVLDLRWLSPLDHEAVAQSIADTSRLLVVHEANVTAGFGAEIVSWATENCFSDLDGPPKRLGVPNTRIPASPVLQEALLPSVSSISLAARAALQG